LRNKRDNIALVNRILTLHHIPARRLLGAKFAQIFLFFSFLEIFQITKITFAIKLISFGKLAGVLIGSIFVLAL